MSIFRSPEEDPETENKACLGLCASCPALLSCSSSRKAYNPQKKYSSGSPAGGLYHIPRHPGIRTSQHLLVHAKGQHGLLF